MEWQALGRALLRVRLAKFAAIVLGLTLVAGLFAPWLAPYDPTKAKPWDSLAPPSGTYWLGADRLGRDQLSRLIYGAQVSLSIGVGGVAIAVLLGMTIGVTAGWYGGMWDEILMRCMDGLSAFPSLLLALALVAITGGSVVNILLVVGIVGTPWVARVIRSQVLSLREREFIVAVRGLGAQSARIMLKHLLPNCLAPVIVQASLSVAAAILLEASLSFLGVGVKPPTPTWGGMLRHAFETVGEAPWLTVSPGVMIFLVVLAFNFFGDALRDVLDPKLRGTR
ncbi:MAG: ABC transporter permease [Candidatus Tectomicrobia bacterium]|uniref:ABC transporter permease n=1 Tax=Tectimicrobiota bacterium TaxID=2528274 RepID=A0A937W1C6_UNCTE|nr:ABC transporter permease [Candidatus Tectomicrobia bacterium]